MELRTDELLKESAIPCLIILNSVLLSSFDTSTRSKISVSTVTAVTWLVPNRDIRPQAAKEVIDLRHEPSHFLEKFLCMLLLIRVIAGNDVWSWTSCKGMYNTKIQSVAIFN